MCEVVMDDHVSQCQIHSSLQGRFLLSWKGNNRKICFPYCKSNHPATRKTKQKLCALSFLYTWLRFHPPLQFFLECPRVNM
ncbi:hypothetical protein FKM82_010716 [Ascaphus truei]